MKDYARSEKYIECVYEKYIAKGHPYPYYCAEAGHMLLALGDLTKQIGTDENTEDSNIKSTDGNGVTIMVICGVIIAGGVCGTIINRRKKHGNE